MLSWVAPFDGNRPITQYVIYVSSSRQPNLTQIHPPLGGGRTRRQTTGDSTDPVPSVTVTGDPTTVIVSDLIPFVEYSYTVEAVNELGMSDMSQPSPFLMTEAASESGEEQYIPLYSKLLGMYVRWLCSFIVHICRNSVYVLANCVCVCVLLSSGLPTPRLCSYGNVVYFVWSGMDAT